MQLKTIMFILIIQLIKTPLPIDLESDGTQKYFELSGILGMLKEFVLFQLMN